MSSMVRASILVLLLSTASASTMAQGQNQDGSEWDHARAQLIANGAGTMAMAVDRWRVLSASDRFGFDDYASFMLTYPGFPEHEKMRLKAEKALERSIESPSQVAAFFDRYPPITNPARAQYALALSALQRPEAVAMAREAWRDGPMSDPVESALLAQYGSSFAQADHDARVDALLWAGETTQAERAMSSISAEARPIAMARLAYLQGADPAALGLTTGAGALADAGFVYNRARYLRRSGQAASAAALLANRPALAAPVRDPRRWVKELLEVARAADPRSAARIAASIDDAFAPGADVSRMSFPIRDDYTSLMWLGGTKALWTLRDPAMAAPLFHRYGAAARSPQTRAKGFYWAGRAAADAGDSAQASRNFELAAAYSDQFYGLLALERLGRPLPPLDATPTTAPTEAERLAFNAAPLTAAVREVARESDWPTTVRFLKEICEQAETEGEHVLVADLARTLGRRDLAVILGQSAHADGFGNFRSVSYPLIPVPPGASWTMVHAISRQESQFAMNAVSHAGARGLMQLMPGTAREQAGMAGLAYDPQALTRDAGYNIRLGDGYFARMMDYYGGSYPLAVAAYNAGPGNVNRFLRANGDPRNGGIDWIEWIEKIPLSETRNYVQRVLENAVVYEALNPSRATYAGPNPLSHFLGKRQPG